MTRLLDAVAQTAIPQEPAPPPPAVLAQLSALAELVGNGMTFEAAGRHLQVNAKWFAVYRRLFYSTWCELLTVATSKTRCPVTPGAARYLLPLPERPAPEPVDNVEAVVKIVRPAAALEADPFRSMKLLTSDSPDYPTIEWTLPRFFTDFVKVYVLVPSGSRPRNIESYEGTIRHWLRLTSNPPLAEIDQRTCAEFVDGLQNLPGRQLKRGIAAGDREVRGFSPNTVIKRAKELQFILNHAGPPTARCRSALEILYRVPFVPRPRSRRKIADDAFTSEEIKQWLDTCHHLSFPKVYRPRCGEWWAGLVRWVYYTGLRIENAVTARWSWIQDRWLNIPGEDYKGGQPHRFWLSEQAVTAAKAMQEITKAVGIQTDEIAHWPHGMTWLHRCQQRILAMSKIPPSRRFGFHALRKALGTELWRINPGIAALVLGHDSLKMTREHYVNPVIVGDVMDKVPQI